MRVVGGGALIIAIKQIMSGYVGKCLKSGPDRDKIGDSIERGNVFFLLFFFFSFCLLQLRGNSSDGVACMNQMLSWSLQTQSACVGSHTVCWGGGGEKSDSVTAPGEIRQKLYVQSRGGAAALKQRSQARRGKQNITWHDMDDWHPAATAWK